MIKKTAMIGMFFMAFAACNNQAPAAPAKAPTEEAKTAQQAAAAPASSPVPAASAAPASPQATATGTEATAPAAQQAALSKSGTQPTAAASKVARVVVLEKQECCECTRTRQEKSWEAMQQALKSGNWAVETVKVFTDTQPEEAGLYTALKPMMVSPAYYFLDANGDLVEMLQGELEAEAITKILVTKP